MELIDRAAAINAIVQVAGYEDKGCIKRVCKSSIKNEMWIGGVKDSLEAIEKQPTIEAVPIVRGKWEEPQPSGVKTWDKHVYAQCSVCGHKSYLGWCDNYCRFCGAKMEGQHDGTD